uniref:POX domain-containing protein n=1 Tax=Cannabis sativa TaxID=3483 RepID=A0A803PF75_CANSA
MTATGIFSTPNNNTFTSSSNNGNFDRSSSSVVVVPTAPAASHQHHIAQQIRRDKLRVQAAAGGGYEPPPLVGLDHEEDVDDESGTLPSAVYESAGMLSEMFNFPQGPHTTSATELLEQQAMAPPPPSYRSTPRPQQQQQVSEWYGQGLSLTLSSPLDAAAKAEELRMGNTALLYYGGGGVGGGSSSGQDHHYPYNKNHNNYGNAPGGGTGLINHHQVHVGFGSSLGVVNVLRNSNGGGGGGGGSSSSSKDHVSAPPLSAADRIEHQRRKVDRRYNHYCEQMQMVVNSFDLVMGFGAAVPYTALAQKAMSRHFRCLKDAILAQLKHSCELLGEKDGGGSSGITKGETPRLKILEQSLRQQRAFQSIGMMEQEAWRPQRGLPERSVNILRAWLFEHFLHPYPSDADKHLLARQTGLSRNQYTVIVSKLKPSFLARPFTHMASLIDPVVVIDSASMEDKDTTFCRADFQFMHPP